MGDEGTRTLAETLVQEVAMAAKSSDRALTAEYLQALMERTEKMRPYHTSMKLDRDAKRPLEVEAIFGNPLRSAIGSASELRSIAQGIKVPHIQMLYQQLKFLDRKIQGLTHD